MKQAQNQNPDGGNAGHNRRYKNAIVILATLVVSQFLFTQYVADAGELSAKEVLDCTNLIRQNHAQAGLYTNELLNRAAENKLADMEKYDYWAHQNPETGKYPWDFVDEAGYYYQTSGENLAFGFDNSQDICDAWKNSPKHLENIVDPSYQEVGLAIDKTNLHKDAKGILVVMMFGSRKDFTVPALSGDDETVTTCDAQDASCSRGSLPQVKGAKIVKAASEEKQGLAEKYKNNLLFVIGFLLFSWISVLIYAKLSTAKKYKNPR